MPNKIWGPEFRATLSISIWRSLNLQEAQRWRLFCPAKQIKQTHKKKQKLINNPDKKQNPKPNSKNSKKKKKGWIFKIRQNLEQVFERCSGELGLDAFVPASSLLERNIGCGRDQIGPNRDRSEGSRSDTSGHWFDHRPSRSLHHRRGHGVKW